MKIWAIVLFVWLFAPKEILAEWLCPRTFTTYPTQDECRSFCPGVECIESETYVCAADLNGDGEIGEDEYAKCTLNYYCPVEGGTPCNENDQCVVRPVPQCPAGSTYSVERNRCERPASTSYVCPSGWNLDSTRRLCYRFPTCPSGSTYRPDLDLCEQIANCYGQWDCPLPGDSVCVDVGVASTYEDGPSPDFSYYRDDGEVSTDGECLDQIYIFSGRPVECRKAGIQTGFHNCCDADDDLVADLGGQLSLLKGTFAVVTKLKDAISLASQAYELYNMAQAGLLIELERNALIRGHGFSSVVVDTVAEVIKNGGSLTDAMTQSVINGLNITPQGIVLSIAINFALDWAMDILLGGCDEEDMLTAAYNELGLCHYVDTYCKKKIPLIGCVQKAKVYCCFNSKLARIIHEQGRPQLETFGGWGDAEEPNCRGFRPEEFQMLDFSRIDLSEWYGDIQTRVQSEIQRNLRENIERFQQNLRPG